MNLAPIRRLVRKTKQCDPKKLGRDVIVYIDISSIDRQTKRIAEPQLIPVDEAPSRARKLVEADDVVVSTVRPNLNSVAVVPVEYHDEIASTGFCVLRAKRDVLDPLYLFYFTQTDPFVSRLTTLSIGAGYPAVSDANILDTQIPLPPLPEQQHIAAILARADRLRRLRRTARELSDTYLQSVFLEMFGDPVSNPMGWPIVKLGSVGKLDRGKSRHRPRNATKLYGGPYPFVQTGDVANASGYIRTYSQTYSEAGLRQSRLWPSGTLCITIAANIAKTAILTFEACFPDSVVGFIPNGKTNVEFIQQWFSFVQGTLEATAPEVAQKNINLRILRSLDVTLPPLPLQQRFTHIVHRFERLRAQQREAERQAEHLFQTLLQRAFRGEV
jgi:type I restriction enzyme S subunit